MFVSVTPLTRQKIDKYKHYTCDELLSLDKRPFNFANYSKLIDKLNETNLNFEIENLDGFNLLEFNGYKFKSIEFNGGDNIHSLKKFESVNELNNALQTFMIDRYNDRLKFDTESDLLEIKLVLHLKNRIKEQQKNQTKDNNKEIEK